MKLPFSLDQFFSVFEAYNLSIWPTQIIAYMPGILAFVFVLSKTDWSSRFISGVLSMSWIWVGFVYHIINFLTINPAANLFGIFFIAQGLLFIAFGCIQNRLEFEWSAKRCSYIGTAFIIYSMIIYPFLGYILGHHYPATPMFGVTPCPATIYTFGMLLLVRSKVPWYLILIPFLWSLIGMSAALHLSIPQDYGLVIAGLLGTTMIFFKNQNITGKNRPLK